MSRGRMAPIRGEAGRDAPRGEGVPVRGDGKHRGSDAFMAIARCHRLLQLLRVAPVSGRDSPSRALPFARGSLYSTPRRRATPPARLFSYSTPLDDIPAAAEGEKTVTL